MTKDNTRPSFDKEIQQIANYVIDYEVKSDLAYSTARYCLLDSLACAFQALAYENCTKLLGPIVPGAVLENGVRIPGTQDRLEPVRAAFNIGAMVRWLDFNDTWLAAEWGHPSDNLGAILAVADYQSRNQHPLTMRDVLTAMIKAHEIQGIIALKNSFNRVGLDHVILVKLASTAVATHLLGGDFDTICNALSLALVDGQSLRTYRHSPNTGSRKSWAAGDATSRGVLLALNALRGEMGYPSALTAKTWGFYDVSFKGQPFVFEQPYTSYVMENVLFKISFPAEFHAQTAVEAAIQLHSQVVERMDQIANIKVKTQESAIRIIDKQGPLYNPADRDHCLQYMIAIGLIYGELTARHYEDDIANNPLVDQLRTKMQVEEEQRFSEEYVDLTKRSIGNSIQVFFTDGSSTDEISIDYPIGHRRRRDEGIPALIAKYQASVSHYFAEEQSKALQALALNPSSIDNLPVDQFMDKFSFE